MAPNRVSIQPLGERYDGIQPPGERCDESKKMAGDREGGADQRRSHRRGWAPASSSCLTSRSIAAPCLALAGFEQGECEASGGAGRSRRAALASVPPPPGKSERIRDNESQGSGVEIMLGLYCFSLSLFHIYILVLTSSMLSHLTP
jgi:hypothetical protein